MNKINSSKVLSEEEFYHFVLTEYHPSKYESDELEDARFYDGTYYSHICKTRCYLVYREIAKRLSNNMSKIIDLGLFPGTLIRQLKVLLNDRISCYGAGLRIDDEFRRFMTPAAEETRDYRD